MHVTVYKEVQGSKYTYITQNANLFPCSCPVFRELIFLCPFFEQNIHL